MLCGCGSDLDLRQRDHAVEMKGNEMSQVQRGGGDSEGAHGTPRGHSSSPAPLRLPRAKVGLALPELSFLKRHRKSGCFCAISLCINIGNRSKHLHSAHVGELWPQGYQLIASSPGPYKLQCEGLASLVTPGLASEPYL